MKLIRTLATFAATLALTTAFALPPEIELDRLLLQAKAALDEKNYPQASESLAKAEKLGIALPDTFYFHAGRAAAGAGKPEQSLKMFERYLTMSGTRGKFYQEALVEMNTAEAAIKTRDAGKAADRAKYNEALADYRKKVEECPESFRESVRYWTRQVQNAESSCEQSNRYASCEYIERVHSTDARVERLRQAKSKLREIQRKDEDEYCDGRYSRPSLPDSLK